MEVSDNQSVRVGSIIESVMTLIGRVVKMKGRTVTIAALNDPEYTWTFVVADETEIVKAFGEADLPDLQVGSIIVVLEKQNMEEVRTLQVKILDPGLSN